MLYYRYMAENTQDKLELKMNRRSFVTGAGITAAGIVGLTGCSKSGSTSITAYSATSKNAELYPIYENGVYVPKDFSALTKNPALGLSPEIIEHHLGLYNKYIVKVNDAEDKMAQGIIDEASMKNLAFSLNGMALHDIYFSNMTTDKESMSTELKAAIENTFGTITNYMSNLTEIASQVKGWSVTALNLLNGQIFNYGLENHSANFPNFVIPLLALDVYEHAYVTDFGEDGKAAYLDVFQKIINWDLVSRRYSAVVELSSN